MNIVPKALLIMSTALCMAATPGIAMDEDTEMGDNPAPHPVSPSVPFPEVGGGTYISAEGLRTMPAPVRVTLPSTHTVPAGMLDALLH